MSSRTLRKAQKKAETLQDSVQIQLEDDVDFYANDANRNSRKPGLFSVLHNASDDENEAAESAQSESDPSQSAKLDTDPSVTASKPKSAKSKKKRKKTKSGKGSASRQNDSLANADSQMDEIDLALRALSATEAAPETRTATDISSGLAEHKLHELLSIDSQHLQAKNEVRRLFGRAALEVDHGGDDGGGRRRGRAAQLGLAEAVAGRANPNRGLAMLGLRRNIFVEGKEEWPRTTGGGLGMEVEDKRPDGAVLYRFVHNRAYQDVQRQFHLCVASMDANRMVQLLQYNPYHVSTLLQVSEIAKQERDHATSGDLLERALFSFGRSVHSTFTGNLSQGKARLDFRRPENREFSLASLRYISNLSMRATWRTAFEWLRLILSLDPQDDPYCVRLIIDQYAIRARQAEQLIALFENKFFEASWGDLCNIQISLGLAFLQVGNIQKAKAQMTDAINRFPWVIARLFRELGIDKVPPNIWGKLPPNLHDEILQELYVTRAKDVWNTPEATAFLVGATSSVGPVSETTTAPEVGITRDLARHVILTDTPSLIALIPRPLLATDMSVSDPLPPEDDLESYEIST